MTLNQTLTAAVLCALFGSPIFAQSGDLYNSFGPGDSSLGSGAALGYGAYAGNGGYVDAFDFFPTATGSLDQIRTAIEYIYQPSDDPANGPKLTGPNQLNLWLMSDNSGSPGNVLESFLYTGPSGATLQAIITLNSVVHPILVTGVRYWLAAAPVDLLNSGYSWLNNNQSIFQSYAQRIGTGTWGPTHAGALTPAFEIIGTLSSDHTGPITSAVIVNPNPLAVGALATVTAQVSDLTTGDSNVASVEYNIDGGSFTSMVLSAFNSVSVGATAALPAFATVAVHNICVRGSDVVGNVGAVACVGLPTFSTDRTGPITTNVQANQNPLPVGSSDGLTANVSDVTTGNSNIAAAEYNIDGGSFTPMVAYGLEAFNSASVDVTAALPAFPTSGVHTICVRGRDVIGNVGGAACILLPVYDPNGGFTTGSGRIPSPPGSDLANSSAAGQATFGFVSKYLPGRNTPDGNLEFQFQAGNLNFKSTSMDWLVVSGEPRSIFHGTGTIDGTNVCKFEVDAWDASFQPGNADAFGLKILSCANGGNRYYLPASPLISGSIIVHK